ncbi:MAG: molybdopterin-binding protein, partial [Thermoplasmata archaeon]
MVTQGAEVDGYAMSALLAAGITRILVRHVRVRVYATGSELRAPTERSSDTLDTIGPALTALLDRWTDARYAGVLPDDPKIIARTLRHEARRNDLLVTIGGSSVGPKDFTKRAVSDVGRVVVAGTRVNVLKRAGVEIVGRTPVLILPGQIESAVVAFHEYGTRPTRSVGRIEAEGVRLAAFGTPDRRSPSDGLHVSVRRTRRKGGS